MESEASGITSDEMLRREFDGTLLEEFLKRNLYKLADSSSKKELEDMLGFYIEKMARREHNIQNSFGGLLKIRAEIEESETKRSKLEEILFEQDHDFH
jgi:hypothetical protein